jgi:hypothetical protein
MTGSVSPETCWASCKYEINILIHCYILLDFLCELYYDAQFHEHQIEFHIYIYSSAKLSKNHEPHTVHLNTLFCYEVWYIFKLYVHFLELWVTATLVSVLASENLLFWQRTNIHKVWNFWWRHFRRCSMRIAPIVAILEQVITSVTLFLEVILRKSCMSM